MEGKRKISVINVVVIIMLVLCLIMSGAVIVLSITKAKNKINTIAKNGNEIKNNYKIISRENKYYINTAQDLWDFAEEVNNGNTFEGVTVSLTDDIDLGCDEENQWIPIGVLTSFEGVFDGKNYKISGLYIGDLIGKQYYNIGLFGKNMGTIKNLKIVDSLIEVNNIGELTNTLNTTRLGGITAINNGNLINCYNSTNINITLVEETNIDLGGIVRA